MSGSTKIEWADKVWNPVTGCTKVSPGCAHCYAERMAKRLAGRYGYPGGTGFAPTSHTDLLDQPLHWRAPSRIFVCSMGDLFHEDVPAGTLDRVLLTIQRCRRHTFLLLTKRPKRALEMLSHYRPMIRMSEGVVEYEFPPSNLWIGVSVEDQATADERIPLLMQIPAAHRFVSVEPMLGPVSIDRAASHLRHIETPQTISGLQVIAEKIRATSPEWVIAGGETGPGARPMAPEWPRALRDDCQDSHIPFFFKQWGGVHKKKTGRELDGRTWEETPWKD